MPKTQLVAILNVTNESFSHDGIMSPEALVNHYQLLLDDGADYIDIGAQATNYNASMLTAEDEIARLKPIIEGVKNHDKSAIDSFRYEALSYCYDHGVKFFNDVSAASDERVLKLVASDPQIKYVLTLSLCVPADRSRRIASLAALLNLAQTTINRCLEAGISRCQLILDPGIGFACGSELSLELIRAPELLKHLQLPLYYGHSRKSYLESITQLPPKERDIETLAASNQLWGKVDFLRVHNLAMHRRFFKTQEALQARQP